MEGDEYKEQAAQLRLQRLEKFNADMERELAAPRVPASTVCGFIVRHIEDTPDYLVSSVWKLPEQDNVYRQYKLHRKAKKPAGCCVIC
ncbi:guanine nucleotide-binding protein subunit gamma [Diutina catenulata]